MLIRDYINQSCGHALTDLRMGAPVPTTNFASRPGTLTTETQRKAAINSKFQFGREPHELQDWLEAQLQRFVLLGINANSYDAVIWVTSRFFGLMNIRWLNRKQEATIPAFLTYLWRSFVRVHAT
jgi:hypothetical protein